MRTIKEALGNHKVQGVPKHMTDWPCREGLSYYRCQREHDKTCPGFTLDAVHWDSRQEALYHQLEALRA